MSSRETLPARSRLALWLSCLPVALHLVPNEAYGDFIDELYYLACARRPAAGYVDHPPLSIWILRAWTTLFGDSTVALRTVPALASGALVGMSVSLARRLGGGPPAQVLTAIVVALAPGYLGLFDIYSMNALEVLAWTGIASLVLYRVQADEPRAWLALGLLFGLALLNKHTVVLLAAGLLAGCLVTPLRRDLLGRWLWLGVGIAALVFLPNLLWQVRNDWPSLEFYRNAHADKNLDQSVLGVLIGQALAVGPVFAGLGLVSLALRREHRAGRWFVAAYAVLLASMITSGSSRPDRIAGSYPLLFAAGAAWLERLVGLERGRRRRALTIGLTFAASLVLVPIAVASMPQRWALGYAAAMGDLLALERGGQADLPLWLDSRRGWRELALNVARACEHLTPEERPDALIYAASYGRAGALERHADELDLPPVICSHNSYWHWSEGRGTAPAYVILDLHVDNLEVLFEEYEVVVRAETPGGRAYPIYVARRPKVALADVWDQLRTYR